MQKRIISKINRINDMLGAVDQSEEIPYTYDGGTWPYYVELMGPITTKGKYVYIDEAPTQHGYGFEKRYNTNKPYGIGSLEDLNHHLNLINRSFKKVIS